MSKKKYLEIRETIDGFDIYELEGRIDQAIMYLQALKKNVNSKYEETYIEVNINFDGGDDSKLIGARLETDEERDKRLLKEKKAQAIKKKKKEDRKQKLIKEAKKLGLKITENNSAN